MSRAYPPVWCERHDCKKCNLLECNSRSLGLFEPYRYPALDFGNRSTTIEITSIAVYFGFCQRLAKLFLLFRQDSPIAAVTQNFINGETGLPTKVSIQRILLDMLNHGDPEAPTDAIHRLRSIWIIRATGKDKAVVSDFQKDVEIAPSATEIKDFMDKANTWQHDLVKGKITVFEKTDDLNRCKYCFLEDCEQI